VTSVLLYRLKPTRYAYIRTKSDGSARSYWVTDLAFAPVVVYAEAD
jgi:hypothetical protein